MDENLIEKEVKTNTLYSGRIINLRVDDVALPNGTLAKREYVEHRGGAAVLAIDEDDRVYLVRQYRYPYRELTLEIPAGKLEAGEAPNITAARELAEETGLQADSITPFGVVYPTPGYTNEKLHIYLATGLKYVGEHPDRDEFLNVVRMPFATACEKVMRGELKDAKTCYAILKYTVLCKR